MTERDRERGGKERLGERVRERERERCYFGEIFVHLNCYDTLLSCYDF